MVTEHNEGYFDKLVKIHRVHGTVGESMIFCDWSHWWTHMYHLLMKAWPGDLPVGKLGDLQAMFSSITGRGEFTFHIWILGPSEVYAVSWGKFIFLIWILGLSEVCAFLKFYIAKLNPSSSLQVYLSTVYQHMNLYILTDLSVSVYCLHDFPLSHT